MSAQCEVTMKQAAGEAMSTFERYLSLWVFICIVAGIAFGQALPSVFQAIGRMEVAQVNLPVGLLIWVMIIPIRATVVSSGCTSATWARSKNPSPQKVIIVNLSNGIAHGTRNRSLSTSLF